MEDFQYDNGPVTFYGFTFFKFFMKFYLIRKISTQFLEKEVRNINFYNEIYMVIYFYKSQVIPLP